MTLAPITPHTAQQKAAGAFPPLLLNPGSYDTIVAKFLQVRLREAFPTCETHILICDTQGAQIEYL